MLKSSQKFDAKKAREWLFRAESQFKFDKSVIDLKEKLFELIDTQASHSGELEDWEKFLLKAIVNQIFMASLQVLIFNIQSF
jgi:hypothetical protein